MGKVTSFNPASEQPGPHQKDLSSSSCQYGFQTINENSLQYSEKK